MIVMGAGGGCLNISFSSLSFLSFALWDGWVDGLGF